MQEECLCPSPVPSNPAGNDGQVAKVGNHGAKVDQVGYSMCDPKSHPSFLPLWSSFIMLSQLQHELCHLGENDEALESFLKAMQLDPSSANVCNKEVKITRDRKK